MSRCLCSNLMWVDQILEDHFKGAKPPLAINDTEQTVCFSFLSSVFFSLGALDMSQLCGFVL